METHCRGENALTLEQDRSAPEAFISLFWRQTHWNLRSWCYKPLKSFNWNLQLWDYQGESKWSQVGGNLWLLAEAEENPLWRDTTKLRLSIFPNIKIKETLSSELESSNHRRKPLWLWVRKKNKYIFRSLPHTPRTSEIKNVKYRIAIYEILKGLNVRKTKNKQDYYI